MPKRAYRSKRLPPVSGLVQLQLKDGCGCLKSHGEVEVELIVRRTSDGVCIGLTRELYFVYPLENCPGWFRLVSRTVGNLLKEPKDYGFLRDQSDGGA